MPQPPAQPPTVLSTLLGFAAGNDGATIMPNMASVQTLPSANPPVSSNASSSPSFVGVDIAPFSFTLETAGVAGAQTITFPNLPYRNNTQNPLAPTLTAAQQPFSVTPQNLLLLVAFIQGLTAPNGTVVGLATQAVNTANAYVPGPILGTDVYRTFQAIVSATGPTSGVVSGTVIGLLFQSNG